MRVQHCKFHALLDGRARWIRRKQFGLLLCLTLLFASLTQSGCAGLTNSKGSASADPAPSIITQPASQTVTAGQTGTFSVSAAGTAPLSYQWKKNRTAISGATSSRYTTPAETTSDSGAQFTVVLSNSAGSATSSAAILTVNAAPPVAPLQVTSGALPDGQVGVPYQTALTASGGVPPYNWTVANALPQGLSLNASSGAIAGTPTQSGTTTLLVQLADSSKQTTQESSSIAITSVSAALDQYGGRTDITCTATGWFHTQKIGKRWWLCDPLGNVFWSNTLDDVSYPLDANIVTKYGSYYPVWVEETDLRVEEWKFNTLGLNSYFGLYPWAIDSSFPLDSHGLHSQPVKLPFIMDIRPGYYSMLNQAVTTNSEGTIALLTNPVKNMLAVHTPVYSGYVYTAIPDWYDSGIGTWMLADLQNDTEWSWFNNGSPSPYVNYLIGMEVEDSDETAGFKVSPDFTTDPPGGNNFNLGVMVAMLSPIETANSCVALNNSCSPSTEIGYVYTDTKVYSKLALRNALATKYGTIGAMNTAWGSSYTTFDSSGVCVGSQPVACASSVSADSVGTGNGSTLTFGTTLSHTTVSLCSFEILVAGSPVAGDDTVNGYPGDGCTSSTGVLWGPNSSGTINYSTGVISITFTGGHAPANGAAITATYVANGWRIGTGFLDEDGRFSHQGWMGTDFGSTTPSNVAAPVLADLNTFLKALAAQFFSTSATALHTVLPNVMYLGPNSLSTFGVPAPAPVLQAAASYMDAFATGNDAAQFSKAMMDYVETNYGDKPYFGSTYTCANADSAESGSSACSGNGSGYFSTQAARGASYVTQMGVALNTDTTAGNYPYVGMEWFDYQDFPGSVDWGLITPSDNAYDGHEPASGSVTCSGILGTSNTYGGPFTCGSVPTPSSGGGTPPFGNLITFVKAANILWLQLTSGINGIVGGAAKVGGNAVF